MCGGSSASTDRGIELGGFGQMGNILNTLKSQGGQLYGSGTDATAQASKYYQNILQGRPGAMGAASPEITSLLKSADALKKQTGTMGTARGGGVAGTNQQTTDTTRGQIADTVAGQRGGAAKGLTQIGEASTGQGITATGDAGTIATNLTDLAMKSRAESQQIHNAAVQQWADVAGALLFGAGGDAG